MSETSTSDDEDYIKNVVKLAKQQHSAGNLVSVPCPPEMLFAPQTLTQQPPQEQPSQLTQFHLSAATNSKSKKKLTKTSGCVSGTRNYTSEEKIHLCEILLERLPVNNT